MEKLNLLGKPLSIGAIPSSYLNSLSYEEQILYIGKKIDDIISFINDILNQAIIDYVDDHFNDIMINSMYDNETETLILYIDNN